MSSSRPTSMPMSLVTSCGITTSLTRLCVIPLILPYPRDCLITNVSHSTIRPPTAPSSKTSLPAAKSTKPFTHGPPSTPSVQLISVFQTETTTPSTHGISTGEASGSSLKVPVSSPRRCTKASRSTPTTRFEGTLCVPHSIVALHRRLHLT